ncbi:MAG: hypothetical protein JOZ69_11675, partial [Myxococcales bacterium]|nr:hypothetical protein [Myxococcales bacterium]
PLGDLNLPRNKSEGDIPLTAISTGSADPLECVLLKMGVDQTEFTPDTGTGRIHLYGGGASTTNTTNGGTARPGVTAGTGTHSETTLFGTSSGGTFMNYDQILLPCWGAPAIKTATQLGDLVTYANGGGHLFDTHYSYSWFVGNAEFDTIAHWNPDFNNPGNVNWTLGVSKAVPLSPPAAHGGVFAKWLNLVGALSNASNPAPANPLVVINNPRHDADFVTSGSTDWIDGTDPNHNDALVEHFTFDTPVGASQTCGHGIFSDFHVSQVATRCTQTNTTCASNADCTANTCTGGHCTIGGAACTRSSNCAQNTCAAGSVFPNECTTTFTAQEKILEYMLFDLASCAGPLTPTCNPLTCAQQNVSCGPAGDGCGGQLNCGTCMAPLTCGGGGVSGQCGAPDGGTCQPQSCQQQNLSCGQTGDGCGGVLNCGTCTAPAACVNGQCVAPDASGCTMLSCQAQNLSCGQTGDGCGGVLNCGTCTAPATCISGRCVTPEGGGGCTAATCASQNLSCGQAGDGCGGTLNCGACPPGSSCVGGQCLAPDAGGCLPATCAQQNLACGQAGDGCGGILDCGTCPAGSSCVSGQCVAPDAGNGCTPSTCQQQNVNCGYTGDGCGNLLDCGTCVAPETCGGGGVPGQCGGAVQ